MIRCFFLGENKLETEAVAATRPRFRRSSVVEIKIGDKPCNRGFFTNMIFDRLYKTVAQSRLRRVFVSRSG